LVNYGHTPAKSISMGCGLFLGPKNPGAGTNLPANNPPKFSSPIDVFPNASLDESKQAVTEVGMSVPIAPEQIAVIHRGDRTLCVIGKATYTDVFGNCRPIEFCFALRCAGSVMDIMASTDSTQSIPIESVFIENGNKGD
jgi:hypothetical protein